jgi:hypothetical protein
VAPPDLVSLERIVEDLSFLDPDVRDALETACARIAPLTLRCVADSMRVHSEAFSWGSGPADAPSGAAEYNRGNPVASVHHEIVIEAEAAHVWDAIRDVGAVHERLLPGRVVATRLEGDHRVLTFPNGREVRELIVDLDEQRRRLAYAVLGGDSLGLTYHHASFQVLPEGAGRCRLVWITDLLPHHLADAVQARVAVGAADMQRTLQAADASSGQDASRRSSG